MNLEPQAVWSVFFALCKVPHPSGKEEKLVEMLIGRAKNSGLRCRRDAYGNLRIDREAGDPDRAIILQAHLDMVPACAAGKTFDFENEAISPVVEGNILHADGTTLGGDDGMGVALAMAALEDASLRDVPLAALFTREEETGLLGAQALDREFLRGRALINLDSGCDRVLQIGCAGGVRSRIFFEPETVPAPEGCGVQISVGNLAGGHSGIDIDKKRTNGLILLAKLLKEIEFLPAEISGGVADNVIPPFAVCRGITRVSIAKLQAELFVQTEKIRKQMKAERDFTVDVAPCEVKRIWNSAFAGAFLKKLVSVPDGVVSFSRKYGVVHTSSNIAMIETTAKGFALVSSQRSFDDGCRRRIAEKICRHFGCLAASWEFSKGYPGWKPERSALVRTAAKVWRRENGTEAKCEAVHAGVECGVIRGKMPDLPIIACFPRHGNLHTPAEYLDIASVGRIWKFLRAFLREI